MLEDIMVSFVVIAYNEEANIRHTLFAIIELDGLGDYEIIVIDDGSTDGTQKIVADIAEGNPRVRLVELGENRGRGFARSTGTAAARGDLIAMIDADILLPANWLVLARAALEDYDAVGGTAVPDGDVAYVCRRFRLVPRVVQATTTVTGNNGLYRREVFDVTSFDPELREGEDVALNHAMGRRGLSSMTVPGLLVRHEENKRLGTSLKWLFDSGRGATRQLITYREVRVPDLTAGAFVGAVTCGAYLVMRKHRVLGVAVPIAFVLTASAQHVRSRFETPPSQWSRIAPAVAIDGAMLTAYFAGRVAGLTVVRRRLKSASDRRSSHRRSHSG